MLEISKLLSLLNLNKLTIFNFQQNDIKKELDFFLFLEDVIRLIVDDTVFIDGGEIRYNRKKLSEALDTNLKTSDRVSSIIINDLSKYLDAYRFSERLEFIKIFNHHKTKIILLRTPILNFEFINNSFQNINKQNIFVYFNNIEKKVIIGSKNKTDIVLDYQLVFKTNEVKRKYIIHNLTSS